MTRLPLALAAILLSAAPALALPPSPAAPPFTATPTPAALQSGVIPPTHLRKSISKAASGGTVNVCIAGDSTSLNTPAGVNSTEGLWYHLQRQMLAQNPGVSFSFLNYGIPGTGFPDFLGTSAYTKAQALGLTWYASSGANWYQYVSAANCDLVFLNWGVNDAYNVNPSNLKSIINLVGGFSTHPDIVFLTNGVANGAAGLPYSQSNYQAGYLATPSMVRALTETGAAGFSTTFANPIPPLGLIDVARYFQIAVLGKDYSTQTSTNAISRVPASITINTTTPYTFPSTDGDFDLKLQFAGQLNAMQNTNQTTINITVGSLDGGPGTQQAIIVFTAGGGYLEYYNGSDIAAQTLKGFTGSDATIEVSVNGPYFTLTVNNQTIAKRVIKASAPFTPKISVSGSNPPANLTANILTYSTGTAQKYNPVLTKSQVYGPTVASATSGAIAAAGTNVLTLSSAVPSAVFVGMPVSDVDQPPSIPSGTTVAAIGTNTVTLSQSIAGAGIGATDNISFGTNVGTNGGNGINHDASLALNYIWGSVIRATNLCIVCYTPNGMATASRVTVALTEGQSYTTAQGVVELTANPAANLTAATVSMPTFPKDGDAFNFVSTKSIGTLTINGGTTAIASNVVHTWKYNSGLSAWVQWQ